VPRLYSQLWTAIVKTTALCLLIAAAAGADRQFHLARPFADAWSAQRTQVIDFGAHIARRIQPLLQLN